MTSVSLTASHKIKFKSGVPCRISFPEDDTFDKELEVGKEYSANAKIEDEFGNPFSGSDNEVYAALAISSECIHGVRCSKKSITGSKTTTPPIKIVGKQTSGILKIELSIDDKRDCAKGLRLNPLEKKQTTIDILVRYPRQCTIRPHS